MGSGAPSSAGTAPGPALPQAPVRPPAPTGISADVLSRKIDDFLSSRGYRADGDTPRSSGVGAELAPPVSDARRTADGRRADQGRPLQFVCEDDVRQAIQAGRKLTLSERAIVTPAARDLGEQHRVFTVAPWTG